MMVIAIVVLGAMRPGRHFQPKPRDRTTLVWDLDVVSAYGLAKGDVSGS